MSIWRKKQGDLVWKKFVRQTVALSIAVTLYHGLLDLITR